MVESMSVVQNGEMAEKESESDNQLKEHLVVMVHGYAYILSFLLKQKKKQITIYLSSSMYSYFENAASSFFCL